MKVNDRRVRKTRKSLYNALAELMLTKELQQITVRELADKADIHRATFYTHYKDIYDLYEKLEDIVIEDLEKIIVNESSNNYEKVFVEIIDYVYNNKSICRIFLGESGKNSFNKRVSHFLEEKYKELWIYESGENDITEQQKFWVRYHIHGSLAILSRWAGHNFIHSKEEVITISLKIDNVFDSFKL